MAFRQDFEELTVITKTYDLILWSCHHTGKWWEVHLAYWCPSKARWVCRWVMPSGP
jgi:hypothetical protein